ncbi:MAG: hypothetical protein JWQ33_2558 [Ramlibacter sp.]|nr:hypothetical protein [Ramlibacter sp.]
MQESEQARMKAARAQLERLEGFMREDPANLRLLACVHRLQPGCPTPPLPNAEEQFLSAVSSSGRFTLGKAQGRYADVKRRADK